MFDDDDDDDDDDDMTTMMIFIAVIFAIICMHSPSCLSVPEFLLFMTATEKRQRQTDR